MGTKMIYKNKILSFLFIICFLLFLAGCSTDIPNTKPVANAGDDQVILNTETLVTHNGSGSHDEQKPRLSDRRVCANETQKQETVA